MKLVTTVVFTALCAHAALGAEPAFDFKSLAKPGVSIGGHAFSSRASVGNVALNNAGEAAFIVYDGDGPESGAVYTSKRIVAKSGDAMGGKIVMSIPPGSHVAVNDAGQVAFEAWYADNKQVATAGAFSGLGVFVGDHLVLKTSLGEKEAPPTFALAEDGQVSLADTARTPEAPVQPAQKSSGSMLDRVRVKIPKGLPVTIAQGPGRPNHPQAGAPAPSMRKDEPLFPTNRHGEILVPVNLHEGGFLLLLGTPR